jgi:hypothetical protein
MVGVVLQSGLLGDCSGHCIVVGVVAWPHFVSWVLLLCGRSVRHIAVTFVVWLWWVLSCCVVLRALSLHGCSGHHVTLLRWVSSCCILCRGCCSCMATVGIVLRSCLLHGRSGCRRTMLCRSQGCCVVVVGVITPCGTAVIGPQKRKLAEKREKKKRKMHQRVHQRK